MQRRTSFWQQITGRPVSPRKHHLAIGIFFTLVFCLLYYLGDGIFIEATSGLSSLLLGQPFHEIVLLLFSGVIVYITFTLRTIYAVLFSLAGALLILPHAVYIPADPDPIYRILSWFVINILLAVALGMIMNARERQKIYLRDIINTQEQERHRLSRELHDDTAQELIDVGHDIDEILDKNEEFPEDVRRRLLSLRSSVDEILEKTRRAIQGLQPPLLDEIGITPALYWLCDSFSEEMGIDIEPDIDLQEENLSQEQKLALFRATQESLNNIKKHARAKNIDVKLVTVDNKTILTISDDGVGFTPPGRGKLLTGGKLGLVGLQERIGLLNGTFNLKSKLGEGTTIRAEIPIGTESDEPVRSSKL
ncbi:MAG: sensor histidine kinase [Dehalococcoidales bacterium]|nr:sensor histidine kinase [Dehalococcoidales bacterium]